MIRSLISAVGAVLLGGVLTLASTDVANAQEFLPVEEAFQPQATTDGKTLQVQWRIADGYYLYQESIALEAPPDSGIRLDAPALSPAETKDDPYFGRTSIYHNQATASAQLPADATLSQVVVRYQGCAEDGICYPPQQTTLAVSTGDIASPGSGSAAENSIATASEQDRLTALLSGGSLGWIIAAFYGAGLLLAFTPCVLPMLPILSGVVIGTDTRGRRGLLLSAAYVLPMAAAYAMLGAMAGLAGANLQAIFQHPLVIVPFALIFVALALAMFGFYELQLPAALQSRVAALSARQRGGRLWGAALMGVLSAAIVGPCMTAPLAGALLYISQTGDALLGGTALFALGLGMGTPLLLVGALGTGLLPRAGAWMDAVKVVFGFILLGTAVWMLGRVLPPSATIALWGLLLAGIAVTLGTWNRHAADDGPARRFAQVLGFGAAVWSATLFVGAAAGANNPLQPLAVLAQRGSSEAVQSESYEPVIGLEQFEARLAQARALGQPVVVDFYADWCVSCQIIEREVFGDPAVHQAMNGILRLRPDVTQNSAADIALQRKLQVAGPPSLLFYGPDGNERRAHRVVGEIDADAFLERLRAALKDEA